MGEDSGGFNKEVEIQYEIPKAVIERIRELEDRMASARNILLSLTTLEHHSIKEEMWRINNALEELDY